MNHCCLHRLRCRSYSGCTFACVKLIHIASGYTVDDTLLFNLRTHSQQRQSRSAAHHNSWHYKIFSVAAAAFLCKLNENVSIKPGLHEPSKKPSSWRISVHSLPASPLPAPFSLSLSLFFFNSPPLWPHTHLQYNNKCVEIMWLGNHIQSSLD